MSSNVAGEKKRKNSTSNSNSTNASTPNVPPPYLDFTNSTLPSSITNNNIMLIATMAAQAWQNLNPLIVQRLQQQLRQQQLQTQAVGQKEDKVESKKSKQKRVSENDHKPKHNNNNSLSNTNSPKSQQNTSWPPATSSPTSQTSPHKVRKLKLYSADEKIDIIDYAKVIGNRAAGREFNVAESSIREWRKNEERLRKQSESASNGNQRVELNHTDLIEKLDDLLVEFVEGTTIDLNWYEIRDRAQDLWPQVIKDTSLESNGEGEMQITMGWVTRFMKRNESRVRRIAPPVIATANSTNSHNSSVSMVRSSFGGSRESNATDTPSEKTAPILSSHTNSLNPSPTSSPALLVNTTSRRKCAQPRRAANATLLLTPESEKPPKSGAISEDQNYNDEEPAEKKVKTESSEENEIDSTIKVF